MHVIRCFCKRVLNDQSAVRPMVYRRKELRSYSGVLGGGDAGQETSVFAR